MSQAGRTITPCRSASFPRRTGAPRPRRSGPRSRARRTRRRSRPSRSWCPATRWVSRRGGCSRRASSGRSRARAPALIGVTFLTALPARRAARRAAARGGRSPAGVHAGRRGRGPARARDRSRPAVRAGRRRIRPPRRRSSARTASSPISTMPRSTCSGRAERAGARGRADPPLREGAARAAVVRRARSHARRERGRRARRRRSSRELGTVVCHLPQRVTARSRGCCARWPSATSSS